MKARIVKIDENQIYDDLVQIILPAANGEIELLPDHAELFCILRDGTITLKNTQNHTTTVQISSATSYFKDNELIIIV